MTATDQQDWDNRENRPRRKGRRPDTSHRVIFSQTCQPLKPVTMKGSDFKSMVIEIPGAPGPVPIAYHQLQR